MGYGKMRADAVGTAIMAWVLREPLRFTSHSVSIRSKVIWFAGTGLW